MAFNSKTEEDDGRTANELFLVALLRHQVGLMRIVESIRKRVTRPLDATEAEMAAKIRRMLEGHRGLSRPSDVRRLQRLLRSIRSIRSKVWDEVNPGWMDEIVALSVAEPEATDRIAKTVAPVILDTKLPSNSFLRSIARSRPFEGKVLRAWAAAMKQTDLRRIEDVIKVGLIQGEDSAQIARRVVGTTRRNGRDGITQLARKDAAGITRTAVTAITNQARREFYLANKELFEEELYVATLDGRTTMICKSLDGNIFPVAEGPIPPLHFNCRSLRVAVFNGEVFGHRPARSFTQRGLLREFSQQRGLPTARTRNALPRGSKGDFDRFARRRMRELTGRVPARVTYQQFLRNESVSFQNDTLGLTKAKLFRGGLQLDKFVNKVGDEFTLSELARQQRQAFLDAGLDPDNFL